MIQLLKIISLGVIILLFNWWFPIWWSILFLPFLFSALFTTNLVTGFFTSFAAGLLAWCAILTYQYYNGSEIIATRIAQAFSLPGGGLTLLILNTFIGGFLAGLGGMTGSSLKSAIFSRKKKTYYRSY